MFWKTKQKPNQNWDESKTYLETDTFKNKEFTYKTCPDPQSEASPLDTPASLSHETN